MKIVLRGSDQPLMDLLTARFPEVAFRFAPTVDDEVREIVDADAFHGQPSRQAFLAARQLRWIHEPGTSIDPYRGAIPELVESAVVLTNARGPHVQPMADHAFAMLLALTHHIPELWEDKKARRWDGSSTAAAWSTSRARRWASWRSATSAWRSRGGPAASG